MASNDAMESRGHMLYIKEKDYDRILNHAKTGLPNEACGLLAGSVEEDKKLVEKIYELTNMDASREHFTMNPKEQLEAIKDIRANGLQLLGNFHSHPETPARPSEEDKRLVYDCKLSYLILSLSEDDNPVLKSFRYNDKKEVTEERIEII